MDDYAGSCSFSNDKFRALSFIVDDTYTSSAKLDALRNTDQVYIEQAVGVGEGVYGSLMPLKAAVVMFSASVSRSLDDVLDSDAEDMYFFMAMSSGKQSQHQHSLSLYFSSVL